MKNVVDSGLLQYLIEPDNTIEEAWGKIAVNHKRTLIVIQEGKVVGSLSDGDMRKAILAKRLLNTPVREVMNINFVSLTEDEREKAEKLFVTKDIFLIPVVDEGMNLIDLIIRHPQT